MWPLLSEWIHCFNLFRNIFGKRECSWEMHAMNYTMTFKQFSFSYVKLHIDISDINCLAHWSYTEVLFIIIHARAYCFDPETIDIDIQFPGIRTKLRKSTIWCQDWNIDTLKFANTQLLIVLLFNAICTILLEFIYSHWNTCFSINIKHSIYKSSLTSNWIQWIGFCAQWFWPYSLNFQRNSHISIKSHW